MKRSFFRTGWRRRRRYGAFGLASSRRWSVAWREQPDWCGCISWERMEMHDGHRDYENMLERFDAMNMYLRTIAKGVLSRYIRLEAGKTCLHL